MEGVENPNELEQLDAGNLSFEEFHSLRERKKRGKIVRQAVERQNESEGKDLSVEEEEDEETVEEFPSYRSAAGNLVEKTEIQSLTIILIFLDVIAVSCEVLFRCNVVPESFMTDAFARLLTSFVGFTSIYFALELGCLLFSFREAIFSHFGYMTDMVVVVGSIYWELNVGSRVLRLLGVLRVWRVLRLNSSMVAGEQAKHALTAQLLEETVQALEVAREERARATDALKLEAEARQRVEQMLAGYKDEVETLNEALHIAALSVAENAAAEEDEELEELLGDLTGMGDDDEEEEEGGGGGSSGQESQRASDSGGAASCCCCHGRCRGGARPHAQQAEAEAAVCGGRGWRCDP